MYNHDRSNPQTLDLRSPPSAHHILTPCEHGSLTSCLDPFVVACSYGFVSLELLESLREATEVFIEALEQVGCHLPLSVTGLVGCLAAWLAWLAYFMISPKLACRSLRGLP